MRYSSGVGYWVVMLLFLWALPTRSEIVFGVASIENSQQEVEGAALTVETWRTAIAQALTQVTGVQVNSTATGLAIILQTAEGSLAVAAPSKVGNALIVDIPNAILKLSDADGFSQANPIAGVALVSVTGLPGNRIRVAITGTDAPPTAQISSEAQGLVVNVAIGAAAAGRSEEEIQVVVTGEQDEGYNPSQTSVGTRTATPLRDIPQTIQVIPQQVIEDRNVTELRDVLDSVSGVVLNGGDYGGSGFGIGDYNIRGFRGQITGNGLVNTTGDFSNVEQVEVLRGPASVLFGAGEPGGIINITTKQPLSEPFYEVSLNGDSYDFYRGTADLSGPLTSDQNLRYRVNMALQDSDSFRDFLGTERLFVAPTIAWDISDDTQLTVNFEYLTQETGFDAGIPALSDGSLVLPIDRYFGYPAANDIDTTTIQAGYNFEHRFNENLQLRNSLSISSSRIHTINSDYGSLSDDRFTTGTYVEDEPVYESYAVQTGLLGNFNTGSIAHQVLFGFDANRGTEFFNTFTAPLPPLDIFNPDYDIDLPTNPALVYRALGVTDSYSLYLQDQIDLLDNLILVVAGQLDWVNSTSTDILAGTVDRSYGEAFSPRIGIVYQPIEPISLYASYSRSFNPSFGRSRTGEAFKPERGTQYEVGIRGDLDSRLSVVLAAYEITKSNVLTTDPADPDFSVQVGQQRSRGIDFSIGGEILPGWNLIAGYSYIDARITEDNIYEVGSRLRITPTDSANLWTTYKIQSGDFQGLGFGLGVYFVGDRPGDQFDPPNYKLPAYTRFDASLFYRRDNWDIAINVENLFDTEYYVNSRNATANYPGAPFTLLGSVTVRF